MFPQTNQWTLTPAQSLSTYSIIPQSLSSIPLSSNNPFLSIIPCSNYSAPSQEEATVDTEIVNHKEKMLIQSKKIQVIKIQFQNENNILTNMADHLKALEKKKSFVSRKRRVMGQNKQHEINDRYNEDLDEVKNQRPDGTCEYHNFRNARCWNFMKIIR